MFFYATHFNLCHNSEKLIENSLITWTYPFQNFYPFYIYTVTEKSIVISYINNLQKLVDSVTIIDTAPKIIDIKYFSRCLNKTGELLERQECEGLRVGNVIEFEIVIKVYELATEYFG